LELRLICDFLYLGRSERGEHKEKRDAQHASSVRCQLRRRWARVKQLDEPGAEQGRRGEASTSTASTFGSLGIGLQVIRDDVAVARTKSVTGR